MMSHIKIKRRVALSLALLATQALVWAAEVPADRRITLTDHGYRDWPAALLHYALGDRELPDGPVALVAAAGQAVPAQVEDGALFFVGSLAKGTNVTYTLGQGAPAKSSLTFRATRSSVELGNAAFRLRLPPVGRRTFKTPVPAATVPGPITAWQPAGGAWFGATRFVATRSVTEWETRIIRRGPAVIEVESRYHFAPKGEYVCRVQVCPGIDYAAITEEYDFGAITEGQDFLLVELHRGMTPAALNWLGPDTWLDYAPYVAAKRKDSANPPAPVGGAGPTPMPRQPEDGLVLLDKILPGGRWGGTKGGVGLRGATNGLVTPPPNHVALAPMHVGNWRRALAITTWLHAEAGVTAALPISTRRCTWYTEVADDISPFSTHEHDPQLPESYGRREWALAFGTDASSLQASAGYIGLDAYKDWILEWPETVGAEAYPRAWFTKAEVAELKMSLARHPNREVLSRYYVFSGNVEDAVRHAREFLSTIPINHNGLGNWRVSGLSHYRQSQSLYGAHLADDALACPELPADLRLEVRRMLAVSSYLLSHPDMNPRGSGIHLGNNNMSINRTCALAYFAGLLPDHPRYTEWMKEIADHVAYKLNSQMTSDGANISCPTYWLYGPMRFLECAITIIANTGGPDLTGPQARGVRYLANLTVPDARYNGRRIIPGMGNSANMLESIFGATLATTARALPDFAPLAQRLHRAAWPSGEIVGTPYSAPWFAFRYRPDVPETPATLGTRFLPAYGVVFRNHFGTPQETMLALRAGINWSHCDIDTGNVILYGAGAPLSPGSAYQYYYGPASQNQAIYHNQVKVGARNQEEVFGRVDVAITDYGFGPSVDYAVNSRFYPSQVFADGKGAMSWNRHVLFLKEAQPGGDYFVMRDTFPGGTERPTWWTWLNLGTADAVTVDGKPFDKDATPLDKVLPVDQMPRLTGRTLELDSGFGAGTWIRFANADAPTFRSRLTFTAGNGGLLQLNAKEFPLQSDKETKTIVEAEGTPGADYFYVVVPRKDGTAAPKVERLDEHTLKIVTARSTDTVFVSDEPTTFQDADVTFSGKAGTVRVYADRVVLSMNAGAGRIGYKGMIFEGAAPFERTVPFAELKPGVNPVQDSAVKTREHLELGQELVVEGEGPVQATLEEGKIVLKIEGWARVLYVTRPAWMLRPWMTIDGVPSMACWTDYPASGWGSYDRTHLIAVPVPGGAHTIELSNTVFPDVWPRRFEITTERSEP